MSWLMRRLLMTTFSMCITGLSSACGTVMPQSLQQTNAPTIIAATKLMNHNPMNPALLRRRAFRTLGLILVLSLPLRSTTLVVFFTPHGAIIGADSKSTDATLVDTAKGPVTKIAVVQDHIAI